MEQIEMRSGDFLKDVDIIITFRSGYTDLSVLQKLKQALTASVTSLVDTKIVITDYESKVKAGLNGKLQITSTTFHID